MTMLTLVEDKCALLYISVSRRKGHTAINTAVIAEFKIPLQELFAVLVFTISISVKHLRNCNYIM